MSSGHGAKLPRKKQQAIAALLACQTIQEAAEKVGISPKTLQRWRANPEFQREYREAQNFLYDHAMAKIYGASAQAVSTVVCILNDANAPQASRLRAASTILALCRRANDEDQLEERLAKLEESEQR